MKELQKGMEVNKNKEDNAEPVSTEPIAVSPESIVKHPLEHRWTFWFYENNRTKDWLENLHNVYTFDTVEDFWCLYNHVRNVEDLTHGNDYMIFKDGIAPSWEDPKNNSGGRWICNLEYRQKSKLNEMWLNLVLFLIGESFDEYSDHICGAFINIRRNGNRISLWTPDATKIEELTAVGKKLKYECLHLDQEHKISYESHSDSRSAGLTSKRSFLSC